MKTLNKNKNIIHVSNGDIFSYITNRVRADHTGSTVFVPHVCNNCDVFSSGFAGQIAEKYPIIASNYHILGKKFLKENMGYCQNIKIFQEPKYKHQLYISNMIAQDGFSNSRKTRPLNYLALVKCMVSLSNFIKKNTGFLQKTENVEIHAPKFGSGIAGGNWNFIEDLIEDIWSEYNVYIYSFIKK